MFEFAVAKPRHYTARIGATELSCAWVVSEWELAYRDRDRDRDRDMPWEPIARCAMTHAGGGMFLAAKQAIEAGLNPVEIGNVYWTGAGWEVVTCDELY